MTTTRWLVTYTGERVWRGFDGSLQNYRIEDPRTRIIELHPLDWMILAHKEARVIENDETLINEDTDVPIVLLCAVECSHMTDEQLAWWKENV